MPRNQYSQYDFVNASYHASYNFETGNRDCHGHDRSWRGSRKNASLCSRSNRRKAQRRHK